ncbi:hypothetical protein RHO13_08140 [Orbus wheelerorum]|uniref:hypothetical protein n=1 Tax=Orbus wheelerorum TaxID=3074111 RepID=UPI00370DC869
MPVDLTKLPQQQPALQPFSWWFWAILLLAFVIIGCLTTFILSFFYSISNLFFVLGALILPVVIWGFTFLCGIYYRGYREAYIKKWNLYRQTRRQQLIDYARRALYVLDYSVITEHGESGNSNGVVSNQYAVVAKRPSNGSSPIPHSALAVPINLTRNDFYQRLLILFKQWQEKYQLQFSQLPIDLKIHVRLFIDTPVKIDNLDIIWLKTLGTIIKPTSFSTEDTRNCSTFTEQWLDNSEHDDDLLLVINTHLFNLPTLNEAESAILILFAGENAIKATSLANYQHPFAKVYRAEQTDKLNQTIDNAILWGDVDNKAYDGVWYSSVTTEQNIEIMNYFNSIKFEYDAIYNIDNSIGNTKYSAYFLALVLAIENTLKTQNKQLVMVSEPKLTASVVTSKIREQK